MKNKTNPLHWVESGGGPLVLVPLDRLRSWRGVNEADHGVTDYDRACSVMGYLGVLQSEDGDVLVLGDEPLPTTWLPTQTGGRLVRWVHAESEASAISAIGRLEALEAPTEVVRFSVTGPSVLFDSAEPGDDIQGERLELSLRPGCYEVRTAHLKPSASTWLVVHHLEAVATSPSKNE